jgi:hypothetical protein
VLGWLKNTTRLVLFTYKLMDDSLAFIIRSAGDKYHLSLLSIYMVWLYLINKSLDKPGSGVFAGGFAARKHPIFPYLLRR